MNARPRQWFLNQKRPQAAVPAATTVQVLSTLPPDFSAETTTAEIAVHPTGKFVFS
jgi:6-phosphogluconolactonase (cycloisomerase 2 family)